ncbi:MAG: hypothetical protein QW303_00315 [Nitrososphaerota archaeon]
MNVHLFLEIKNEYTEHLVDTLTPYIYEGLNSIYKEAVRIAEETKSNDKTLLIFQKLLQSVSNWNQQRIEEETKRIKQLSNTSEYFDDLVKAVIKSNIILLCYSNTVSNVIAQTFYNSLTTPTFIHRCYTECAKDAHNNPYLFYHNIDPMDLKRNQIIVYKNIQQGIIRAIRKILPISMILKEYLVNSMNIIQEPPKVELVDSAQLVPVQVTGISKEIPKAEQKIIPEKKPIDPKLEREVMKIIKSESIKSEQQKIRAIMNMDKIITSMEPNKPAELSTKSYPKKLLSSTHSKQKKSDLPIPPPLEENDDENNDTNYHLDKSEKKLVNLNIDEDSTEKSLSKNISGTSLSGRPMPKNVNPERIYTETSERMDPNKIKLIEDYGPHHSESKKKHPYRS